MKIPIESCDIIIFRNKERIALVSSFDYVRIFIKSLVNHESYSVESMVRGEEKEMNGSIFMFDFNWKKYESTGS
jgi:hypothetical protein